jgi:predicted NBD/HSP70 family sugar kinase
MAKDTGVTLVFDIRRLDQGTMAAVTATGEVVTDHPLVVTGEDELLAAVSAFAARLERRSLIGAALAVDGFVDQRGEWRDEYGRVPNVGVVDSLRRGLRMPVFAVNATDAMAIADLRDSPLGLAAQATVVAQPVALGLIVEGRLLNGQNRPAGEIAHLVPGMVGPTCPVCHRPCLTALVGEVQRDDTAQTRELAAMSLATALAPIVAAVELEEIVLALLPPASAADIVHRLHAELRSRLPAAQVPQVRRSRLDAEAVLAGAAAMMVYSRLS